MKYRIFLTHIRDYYELKIAADTDTDTKKNFFKKHLYQDGLPHQGMKSNLLREEFIETNFKRIPFTTPNEIRMCEYLQIFQGARIDDENVKTENITQKEPLIATILSTSLSMLCSPF